MRPSEQPLIFLPDEPERRAAAFPYQLRVLSSSAEEVEQIFELRHTAYRHEGWIAGSAGQIVKDEADTNPQTVHMAAYDGEACTAAVRMTIKNWNDPTSILPCAGVYPALQSQGLRKLSIAELSRLVIDPAAAKDRQTLLFGAMVRAGLTALQAARIAMIVTAVRPEWMMLFTRILRFHTLGKPAMYPPAPVAQSLVGSNMIGAGRREIGRHAFFNVSPQEVASMRAALLNCLGASPQMHVLTQPIERPGN